MPVWHERTKALVEAGELAVVGIVQEQHPDRTSLYAQWRQFEFPILWDPFGLTGLEVVPVLSAIDEHGIVRVGRLDPRRFEEQFVKQFMDVDFEAPEHESASRRVFSLETDGAEPVRRALSDLLLNGPDAKSIDADVAILERAADASGHPSDRFRVGVARRMRADGPGARPGDFQAAVDAWTAALGARPNQYIWRRRIQQWGPRLDKPYAFYDWVERATRDVTERGGVPVRVRVPLSGSEVAGKSRAVPTGDEAQEPDPGGAVERDAGALASIDVAVARHTGAIGPRARTPSGASRVHVALTPGRGAHWTAEADPPLVWLDLPEGWSAASSLVRFEALRGDDPRETRSTLRVDFELSTPPVPLVPPKDGGAPPSEVLVPAYAVYSICEPDGTCVFRRQDFDVTLDLSPPPRGDDDSDGRDD